ncbi:hypothetical protein Dimus_037314 [Dionaea muscipula]
MNVLNSIFFGKKVPNSSRFLVEQLQGFIMLLPTWIDKDEAAAIGGVASKREDLIIVNIDEASGDDELAVAEYAEDIYKLYKLTEGESQVCDYMDKQPDIDERMR